jgi:hypothetical protein
MSSESVMIIAGEHGGKSTFIGALVTYVCDIEPDRYAGDYRLGYGSTQEFDDTIYGQMSNNFKYPSQTNRLDSYVVEILTNTGDTYSAERSVKVMDIPGELQNDAVERIESGTVDEERVRTAYNEGLGSDDPIRTKIDNSALLSDEEEKLLYLYQYLSANRVVFLLNLDRYINRTHLEPVVSTDLIERASEEKRCLLLVTAADEIGYDPDQFRSGVIGQALSMLSASPRLIDVNLYDYITAGNNLPPNQRTNDAKQLVRYSKNNDISIFSVAVPEGPQGDIAVEGGSIKTQGFSQVVDWIFNT